MYFSSTRMICSATSRRVRRSRARAFARSSARSSKIMRASTATRVAREVARAGARAGARVVETETMTGRRPRATTAAGLSLIHI